MALMSKTRPIRRRNKLAKSGAVFNPRRDKMLTRKQLEEGKKKQDARVQHAALHEIEGDRRKHRLPPVAERSKALRAARGALPWTARTIAGNTRPALTHLVQEKIQPPAVQTAPSLLGMPKSARQARSRSPESAIAFGRNSRSPSPECTR